MDLMDSCVEAQHSDAASCYCGGIAWLRGARGEWVVSSVSSWYFMCNVFCCVPVKIEKLDCLYSKTILHVDVHVWTWETISFFIHLITFSRCFKEFVIRPGNLSIGRLRFWMPSFSGLSSPPDWWLLELWCDDLCDDLRRVAIYHQETLGLHVLYDRNDVDHKCSCIPALNYQEKRCNMGIFAHLLQWNHEQKERPTVSHGCESGFHQFNFRIYHKSIADPGESHLLWN